uniref:Methylated-DNA-[protein]-cysteine S-methyltransferase n=1 Tax=Candidatus Kentrum eta TaxID=2126337 RepID=A0A450VGG9_9GAMM|nr:MAG: methylated-DNA-[protein]-cysteine S-methyltransferase [Candidatus Kentron sp. H]VFJ99144.1 MAG: methylated-DNA-[protein]-cysteine S-methyltransferase [Candidatus Kentron sp. H]VFK03817.1 MAG: methylated-DNA-[protein]-cysteine S-methyltransferase [Candidatus Kentron sp. H]
MPSPLGMLSIAISGDGSVRNIELPLHEWGTGQRNEGGGSSPCAPTHGKSSQNKSLPRPTPEFENAVHQLTDYFHDPGWGFDLPIAPGGTPFQQRVWQALRSIPPGKTVSYSMLAVQLGTGARAVGNACRKNPIPIIIPCHRVVGIRDSGGFMGARVGKPLAIKQWLLRHECLSPNR